MAPLQTVPRRKAPASVFQDTLMKLYIDGEKNQHRLTVHGLSYLRELDREIDSQELRSARTQPFCACRCFLSELRRVIRAFAMRTASVLVDCDFGGVLLVYRHRSEPAITGSTGAGMVAP